MLYGSVPLRAQFLQMMRGGSTPVTSHNFGVSSATTISPPRFRASSIENSARLIKSVTMSSLSYSCLATASTIPALSVTCVESHGGRSPDAARRSLSARLCAPASVVSGKINASDHEVRSEEHTSELQSLTNLVCR